MKVIILQVGKTKDSSMRSSIAEFEKRLQAFCDLDIVTLKEATGKKAHTVQIDEESSQLIDYIESKKDYFVIALDVKGKSLGSVEFAKKLSQIKDREGGKVLFVIGGPYGMNDEVKNKADLKLSMSQMTLTHQMIRLFLIEQIYRAFTIITGKQYHY